MMNKIDNSGQGLAKLGRDEDQYMAHVAQGEMVVPPIISPETRERIEAEMRAAGLSPDEYTVGGGMSINPITGLPEFGWLKKKFKQVKKVVKKLAPIAAVIPGPWQGPAIMYNRGKAVVDLARGKGDLGTVIGAFAGGKAGTAGKGNIFQRLKSGIGSYFNPAEGTPGIFKGSIGPSLRRGIGGLFGNIGKGIGKFFGGGQEEIMYEDPTTGKTYTQAQVDEMIAAGTQPDSLNQVTSSGGFLQSLFGEGIGEKTQEGIASLIGGGDSKGIFGGNMGAAALAGLLGKITYDSAKERMGGLAETPAVTMDALGRYQLSKELGTGGTRGEFGLPEAQKALEFNMGGPVYRQYFNVGGVAELDMRDGGESAGPGTGTSDDIPAMLSDGEYVMTAKATRGAGAFDVNKTKSGIELIKGGSASREKGVENMRQLMDIFEAI